MSESAPTRPEPGPRIGLTGGIGSGKSTVAEGFVALGAGLVDTDAISREITGPGGAAIDALRECFGAGMITADGRLDRAAMRALVFAEPAARRQLEAILHPRIRGETTRRTDEAFARGAPYVIVDVPLLVESGDWRSRFDRILVVDCPVSVQIERVMRRSGLARAEVEAIIAAQASREARLAAADDVIDNSGPPDGLAVQIATLHRQYLALK